MCDLCLQKSTHVQYKCSDSPLFHYNTVSQKGTAVAQWLRCCSTNWKVTGSTPDGVIGIFH